MVELERQPSPRLTDPQAAGYAAMVPRIAVDALVGHDAACLVQRGIHRADEVRRACLASRTTPTRIGTVLLHVGQSRRQPPEDGIPAVLRSNRTTTNE